MKTLEQMHARRKRWMTRLVRATNEVHKLDKQIDRMNGKKATLVLKPAIEMLEGGNAGPALDIPVEFKREPQLVDNLKAKREPVDKTAMPLTGRAALDAIKAKSAEVTKRRAKRNLI
jgi:hypothetical protein